MSRSAGEASDPGDGTRTGYGVSSSRTLTLS